jgi:hypothetical protein
LAAKLEARAGIEPAKPLLQGGNGASGCEVDILAASQLASLKTVLACSDLAEVVELWPFLAEAVRASVLALVRAVSRREGRNAEAETLDRRAPDGGGPCLTALASPREGRALGGLGRGDGPPADTERGGRCR